MIRMEIIANSTILEDLKEALNGTELPAGQTWINGARGTGSSGPREGDTVWPDTNVIMVLYLEDKSLPVVTEALKTVKERYPSEGLRCWVMKKAERII